MGKDPCYQMCTLFFFILSLAIFPANAIDKSISCSEFATDKNQRGTFMHPNNVTCSRSGPTRGVPEWRCDYKEALLRLSPSMYVYTCRHLYGFSCTLIWQNQRNAPPTEVIYFCKNSDFPGPEWIED